MKYFVLGAIASGALLYGMSLIYGLTGSLDLERSPRALTRRCTRRRSSDWRSSWSRWPSSSARCRSTCGCRTCTRAHPTSVTLFIGTVPKIAYFALALRLLAQGLAGTAAEWTPVCSGIPSGQLAWELPRGNWWSRIVARRAASWSHIAHIIRLVRRSRK